MALLIVDHAVLIWLAPKTALCSMFPFNINAIPSNFGRQSDEHGSFYSWTAS